MWRTSIPAADRPDLSIAVTEWSRRGPACLLLHGLGEASCVWSHLAVRLASTFRVLAVDLRGHGDSGWDPDANYDGETFASDMQQVIDALRLERLVIIGHSIGAGVAMRLAARLGPRVTATILVDFGPELDRAGLDHVVTSLAATPRVFPSPDAWLDVLTEQRPLSDPTALRTFAHSALRQISDHRWEVKFDPALAKARLVEEPAGPDGRCGDADLWPALARMGQPSLVVRGSGSGVFPQDVAARMVERELPDGRLVTIPRAGHAVMLDNPAAFSEQAIGFLAALRTR